MKVKAFDKQIIPFLLPNTVSQFFYATSGDWVQEKTLSLQLQIWILWIALDVWNEKVSKALWLEGAIDTAEVM